MIYLKEYRQRARLTQQQVAEQLGIQPPAVYKWENNITSPSLRDAERLADVYGISPGQLFENPDESEKTAESVISLIVFAKVAGVLPGAWLHVQQDTERLREADQVTRLLQVWDELDGTYRHHWLEIADLYRKKSADR